MLGIDACAAAKHKIIQNLSASMFFFFFGSILVLTGRFEKVRTKNEHLNDYRNVVQSFEIL